MSALLLLLFLFSPLFVLKRSGAEDESLLPEAYRGAGLPEIDRAWNAEDYAHAAGALTLLAKKNPLLLPRIDSEKSGNVFARIIADENVSRLSDHSRPAKARLAEFWPVLLSMTRLFELYESCLYRRFRFDAEAVELFAFMLKRIPQSFDLIDEMEKDQNGEALMAKQILPEMIQGYTQSFVDAIVLSADKKFYRRSARKKMLGYINDVLPAVINRFPPEVQRDLGTLLKKAS